VQPRDCLVGEERPCASRHRQPVRQVGAGVLDGQGHEVERHPDPLRERAVCAVAQTIAQLRLAHQDDRHEVAVVELEVREEADLLEGGLAGNQVRLVHDQQRGAALPVELQEPLVDLLEEVVRVEARLGHPELRRRRLEELSRREARVEDHPDLVAVAQAVHERAGE